MHNLVVILQKIFCLHMHSQQYQETSVLFLIIQSAQNLEFVSKTFRQSSCSWYLAKSKWREVFLHTCKKPCTGLNASSYKIQITFPIKVCSKIKALINNRTFWNYILLYFFFVKNMCTKLMHLIKEVCWCHER